MRTIPVDASWEPASGIGSILTSLDEQLVRHQIDIDALKTDISRLTEKLREKEMTVTRMEEAKRQLTLVGTGGCYEIQTAISQPDVPEGFAKRQKERRNSQSWQVRQKVYLILKDVGHPLSRAEIYQKLTESGVVIDSPRPDHRVGKILWLAKDAFEYRDNGYWIVGEPITKPVEREKRFRTRKPRIKKNL